MKSHLKVKVFSLSAEMTYIRRQEEKWKSKARAARQKQKDNAVSYCMENFWSQQYHRRNLKSEARSTHLAYGAMRGIPYSAMERICYGPLKGYGRSAPTWGDIQDMVERFSKDEPNQQEIMQRFSEWLDDAKKWYEGNPERIKHMQEQARFVREANLNDPAWVAARAEANAKAKEAGIAAAASKAA